MTRSVGPAEWAPAGSPAPVPAVDDLLPPEIDLVCDAAVDPLEIAAALEAAGVSNRVAQTTFGRADLFVLAQELYDTRPRRPVRFDRQSRPPRYGALEDLALGLLFVVPALSLAVAARALHLALPWWSFPVALSIGWAFGQATARAACCLRNQGLGPGPTVLPSLLLTVVTGAVASTVGVAFGHAGMSTTVTIVLFCTYVASLSVLSVYRELLFMALSMAPALVFSVAFLFDRSSRILQVSEVVAVGTTVAVSLAVALRHCERRWWSPLALGTYERRSVLTYFCYGAGSAVAVSVVTVMTRGTQSPSQLSFVALPVMLSLGVLEWQLHSFRARADHAMHTAERLSAFERSALGNLAVSTGCYLSTLLVVSAAVVGALAVVNRPVPVQSLIACDAVGVALFVGMIVSMCSALHLGLWSWLTGAAAFSVAVGAVHVLGLGADSTALQATSLVGASAAVLVVMIGASEVVRVPFHFVG